MPSRLAIPQKFTTGDTTALKRELERLAQEIDTYLRQLVQLVQPIPTVSKINGAPLAFGTILPVVVPDGATLSVQLPPPDPAQIGRKCGLLRIETTGEVLVYSVGCLVGGAVRYRLANDIHLVEFTYVGDYFPSRFGAGS